MECFENSESSDDTKAARAKRGNPVGDKARFYVLVERQSFSLSKKVMLVLHNIRCILSVHSHFCYFLFISP